VPLPVGQAPAAVGHGGRCIVLQNVWRTIYFCKIGKIYIKYLIFVPREEELELVAGPCGGRRGVSGKRRAAGELAWWGNDDGGHPTEVGREGAAR
jgi:hypothetical protein